VGDVEKQEYTMNNTLIITTEQFTKRFVNLCLRGLAGIPKDQNDQHILLKSAVMYIRMNKPLTEKELNDRLQTWLDLVSAGENLDRVSLRRWLVDSGYLTRDGLGSQYEIAQPEPHSGLFEPAIEQLEPSSILQAAREEMERKKQAYLQKAKGA
jgi:hypothetical protein